VTDRSRAGGRCRLDDLSQAGSETARPFSSFGADRPARGVVGRARLKTLLVRLLVLLLSTGLPALVGRAGAAPAAPPPPLPQTSDPPVTNPRLVEFDPSPDHNATVPGGQPAVERYDFEIYLVGASAPFHTVSLGKPAPQADGKIRYDFSSQVVGWPLPGGVYEARVAAVGPNGRGRSDVSNPFTFGAGCSYTLSTTSLSVGASGGAQSVGVTAPSGCGWTVSTSASWITLTTTSGSGSGTVSFTVAANTSTSSRSGTVNIAGQTLAVTQAGVSCTYTLSTTSLSVGASGGAQSVGVTAPSGCGWTVSTSASWITLTTTSGSGSGTVSFTVAANTSTSSRSGTVNIAGQTLAVTQAGVSCTYTVTPTTLSFPAGGGSATVSVTTAAGCTWSASTTTAWVTLASGGGSGSATIVVTAAANASTATRTGSAVIAGQTVTLSQAAPTPPAAPRNVRVVIGE